MQSSTKVGRIYAEALFELAKADSKVTVCYDDLQEINELYKSSKDFRDFFNSPSIDRDHKIQIINEIFEGKIDRLVLNLMGVLIRKNREASIDNIYAAFQKYKEESENRIYVQSTTAFPLDSELRQKLLHELGAHLKKWIILDEKVDEKIIGGMIIRVSDSVIDGSIRNKLRRLRRDFRQYEEFSGG